MAAISHCTSISSECISENGIAPITPCAYVHTFKDSKGDSPQRETSLFLASFPEEHSVDQEIIYFRISTELSNDSCLSLCAKTVVAVLQRFLISDKISALLTDESRIKKNAELYHKIIHFFTFTRNAASLTLAELIVALIYLYRMGLADCERIQEGRTPIISESTFGTHLLCSVIISQKQLRDTPFKNSWWSKMFLVPLEILNHSEVVFMKKINFNLFVSSEEYDVMYQCFLARTMPECE